MNENKQKMWIALALCIMLISLRSAQAFEKIYSKAMLEGVCASSMSTAGHTCAITGGL
jgi:hypothetical protein